MHGRANPSLILIKIISTASSLTSSASSQHQHSHGGEAGRGCTPVERAALLSFKKGITSDPADILASWQGRDCCRWTGVGCNNNTGHVTELLLRNGSPAIDPNDVDICEDANALSGEISPSLVSLEHLNHIDLSMNCLIKPTSRVPLLFALMKNLRYLNLSGIPFTGRVPPQFGNLSNLQYLDLGFSNDMYSTDITWLTGLPVLEYLSMSFVNLSEVADWPRVLNMVPSLRAIDLSYCVLDRATQSLPLINLTKLEKLDLSGNQFDHMIASSWFWKVTSLKVLKVGSNSFSGQFHDALANMTSLQILDLSDNQNNLVMEGNFKKLCSLEILDLSFSSINGDITALMERLQQCARESRLRELHLSYNNFTGTLPNSIGHFTRLRILDLKTNNLSGRIPAEIRNCTYLNILRLSNNHLNGSVPSHIGALNGLTFLDLSNNDLSGVITEEHLTGLISLKILDMSYNNFNVTVDPNWLPRFRLESAGFGSCKMGPLFPAWLQQQLEITQLDISSAALKDNIPDWFWTTVSNATYLDISHNELRGSLPTYLSNMAFVQINFSSNYLTGPIPALPGNTTMLDISNNLLSGSLPTDLGAPQLHTLLLYSNQISGRIPASMCRLKLLYDLDMSSNILVGEIPQCFDSELIQFFLVSNNNLSGKFPSFLQKCTNLLFLDLAWNNFSGFLPAFIGELEHLQFLRLSHNTFSGEIPVEITNLSYLQYLDLSGNNLSGFIPWHLSNLTAMTLKATQPIYDSLGYNEDENHVMGDIITLSGQFGEIVSVITKGQQLRYGSTLAYFLSLDLSDNSLIGEIPSDITALDALLNLNLSSNHLSGNISNKIGAMRSLESLDLCKNKFSGKIPRSLSNLTSLSFLNLSYNNLSGPIPSGRQLDTPNADNPSLMYIGNSELCGPPLQKNCSGNHTVIHGNRRSSRKELDPLSCYLGIILGFVVGLWLVFCALLFMKAWRIAYFRLFDKLYDSMHVFVVVKWATLTRNTTAG